MAARRAHAAKQRGDGSNQQQRAEQSGVKRVHPPFTSPVKGKRRARRAVRIVNRQPPQPFA